MVVGPDSAFSVVSVMGGISEPCSSLYYGMGDGVAVELEEVTVVLEGWAATMLVIVDVVEVPVNVMPSPVSHSWGVDLA
jgi:hypothetical protein